MLILGYIKWKCEILQYDWLFTGKSLITTDHSPPGRKCFHHNNLTATRMNCRITLMEKWNYLGRTEDSFLSATLAPVYVFCLHEACYKRLMVSCSLITACAALWWIWRQHLGHFCQSLLNNSFGNYISQLFILFTNEIRLGKLFGAFKVMILM